VVYCVLGCCVFIGRVFVDLFEDWEVSVDVVVLVVDY